MIQYSNRLHAQEADEERGFKTFSTELERTEIRRHQTMKKKYFILPIHGS
jgi:hypothetical protein